MLLGGLGQLGSSSFLGVFNWQMGQEETTCLIVILEACSSEGPF